MVTLIPWRWRRRRRVQLVAFFGIIVSAYARYVESKLHDPFYIPSCSSSWNPFGGNCGTVFKSAYGHILSHWGLVEKGSALDLSLATTGLGLYFAYLWAISIRRPWPFREELFLTVAVSGAIFSVYLLYVIKVILKEFCIVCFSFHCCNFSMLALAVFEFRAPEVRRRIKASEKTA
mmetsp:Transcript_94994/g.164137  ORF Transcript_94994/g.164137 Transcript_94994/m.164137 type:complete len:176 (-) Transcript_94994:59-586(-)